MELLSQQQFMKNVEALLRKSQAVVGTLRERLGIDKTDYLFTLYGARVIIVAYYHVLYNIAEVYNLCKSQEMVTRDGTNTVVLIGYELLQQVFKEGISPKVICKALPKAADKAIDLLTKMAVPVDVRKDRKYLLQSTITAIENRVELVDPRYTDFLAEIAVDAASFVADPVRDIWFAYNYTGGKVNETRVVEGYPFSRMFGVPRSESSSSSSITIALIDADILPTDLQAYGVDPIADEVTVYALALIDLCNESGVNLVVIDSIRLGDSATMYAFKLLVDRGGIHVLVYTHGQVSADFISKALNCRPIVTTADFEYPSNFGHADGIKEIMLGDYSYVEIRGIKCNMDRGRTSTIILRGSESEYIDGLNQQYVLNIAIGNLAILFKQPYLIPGGGAPHIQLSIALSEFVEKKEKEKGTDNRLMEQMKCIKLFAKALEVIPWTLARNVGLDPATTVTELKDDHKLGQINAGINTTKGHTSTNMLKEGVVHPLLLLTSAIKLATEFVCGQCKSLED